MRITAPRGWTTWLVVLVAAMVMLSAAGPAASARLGSFPDPQDASRRDLAHVSLQFHPETRRYIWRFTTFERLPPS